MYSTENELRPMFRRVLYDARELANISFSTATFNDSIVIISQSQLDKKTSGGWRTDGNVRETVVLYYDWYYNEFLVTPQ